MSGKFIYTKIYHQERLALGLSLFEYCVADSINRLSTERSKVSGWCYADKQSFAEWFGYKSKTSVDSAIRRLIKKGLVEKNSKNRKLLRTTKKWTENAYEKDNKCSKERPKNGHNTNKEKNKNTYGGKAFSNRKVSNPDSVVIQRYMSLYNESTGSYPTITEGLIERVYQCIKSTELTEDKAILLLEDFVYKNENKPDIAFNLSIAFSVNNINAWLAAESAY